MRIFTADNDTVLTFAGTLFAIEITHALVSHPPFSRAFSRATLRLATQGKSPDRIPDHAHHPPARSTLARASSPRHHSTILFRFRPFIARIALESRRAHVPFRRFVPGPRERRTDRLGRHRRSETTLAHRGSHREARASTHRIRRHLSILSRAWAVDVRLDPRRQVRPPRAAIAVKKTGNFR
jgi:hypothetical protein